MILAQGVYVQQFKNQHKLLHKQHFGESHTKNKADLKHIGNLCNPIS